MSKKKLHSRLENLFANFEDAVAPIHPEENRAASGWSWECSADGIYRTISSDVTDCLGFQPTHFIGQSIKDVAVAAASRSTIKNALQGEVFPAEVDIHFLTREGAFVPSRLTIFFRPAVNGEGNNYHGYVQILSGEIETTSQPARPVESAKAVPIHPLAEHRATNEKVTGVAIEGDSLLPAQNYWSTAGKLSAAQKKLITQNAQSTAPAVLALPVDLKAQGLGIVEILDEEKQRVWSDDERQLVQEVVAQLSLAIENAQLYATVQQELSERVRAEQEITRRNQDLATLNRIGQELARLTSPEEIYELLFQTVSQVLNSPNFLLTVFEKDTLSFPIVLQEGQKIDLPNRKIGNGIADYVILNQVPMIVPNHVRDELSQRGIPIPEKIPGSILAVPLITSDKVLGAIVLQDYTTENAYNDVQIELLSTIASQVTVALENANLFKEITSALTAIENRERYQASIAQAVATLSEFGIKGLPEVLQHLGQASQADRVYFSQVKEDEQGLYWTAQNVWTKPDIAHPIERTKILHMPVALFPTWGRALRENGWFVAKVDQLEGLEHDFLANQGIQSILLLAVPGKNSTPGFIAFEQMETGHTWQNDEISVLRVAADALANTFVRQDLLEQLQASLDESENLYKISHRLALANDFQEMVASIATGMRVHALNRGLLILTEKDPSGKIISHSVRANWYSGRGTPPLPVGTELSNSVLSRLITTESPLFIDDILEAKLDRDIQDELINQAVRSLAVLPLWAGKSQLGALVLLTEDRHYFSGREIRTYPPLVDQMATGVENLRLFEQTQQALSETELLYNLSSGISQARGAQDLSELIAQKVLPADADHVSIILVNQTPDGAIIDLEIVGDFDRKNEHIPLGLHIPVADFPLVKKVNQDVLVFNDVRLSEIDAISKETLLRNKIQSGCIVPLLSAGRLVGLMTISAKKKLTYDQDTIRLFQTVGNGISVAIERQRLLREAQRRALELETAAEIARDTNSTLAQDALLKRIVNLMVERFDFYHTALFLLNPEGTVAHIQEASGQAAEKILAKGQKILVGSRSVIGRTTATGEPVVVNDVSNNNLQLAHPELPETQSEMGIPLKIGNRIIGALDIQSRHLNAFSQADVSVLLILADQIAVAIENARSYELAQKAYQEIREVDRLKSQFLANMSHELRTPLNSIIGFSRVILKGIDGPINEVQQQDLTSIYNSGQHLLGLINNVLDLSKVEAGKMELQFSDVSIPDIINTVMSTAIGLVKDKSIRLEQKIEPNLPIVVADATRVRQVLLNFVSNAAKFTEEGLISIDAKTVTSPDGKPEVMIMVSDTGDGIAEADRDKLFQPFSQVDDSPTRKTGGTGLGLSICRSFIELHKGRIGLLESEVGKGSTFFFTLPIQVKEEETIADTSTLPYQINTILSIDDDQQVINLYERFLQPSGYRIVSLTDPKKAVEKAKEIKPFAITLDIMMPEKDGWQVLHELKNDPATRDIPIIVCSIMEDEEKGFSIGASDYLVKPFLQEDLINALNRLNRDGKINQILVIDDSADDLRLIEKSIQENSKFKVITAQGGKAAIEILQTARPDAILLDLFMPDMNGFDLLEKFRSDPDMRKTPVIIVTGADLTPEQHQLLAEFGQQMLNKSLLRERDLLNTLEDALKRWRA